MTQRRLRGNLTESTITAQVARLVAVSGVVALTTASIAACSSAPPVSQQVPVQPYQEAVEQEEGFSCIDENGVVVSEDYCDDDGDGHSHGGGVFYVVHGYYPSGSHIPSHVRRIPRHDPAARALVGAPRNAPRAAPAQPAQPRVAPVQPARPAPNASNPGNISRGVMGSGGGTGGSGGSSGG